MLYCGGLRLQSPLLLQKEARALFFNRNGSGGVEWLLVGLGNPGSKYESTRHNMGWLALDSLMEK